MHTMTAKIMTVKEYHSWIDRRTDIMSVDKFHMKIRKITDNEPRTKGYVAWIEYSEGGSGATYALTKKELISKVRDEYDKSHCQKLIWK